MSTTPADKLKVGTHESQNADLRSRVQGALNSSSYTGLRGLEVHVENGHIRLNGRVRSYYEKQQATAAVLQVNGVDSVHNQLMVTSARSTQARR